MREGAVGRGGWQDFWRSAARAAIGAGARSRCHVSAVGNSFFEPTPLRRALLSSDAASGSRGEAAGRRGDGLRVGDARPRTVQPGDHDGLRDSHGARVSRGGKGRGEAVLPRASIEGHPDRGAEGGADAERLGDRTGLAPEVAPAVVVNDLDTALTKNFEA